LAKFTERRMQIDEANGAAERIRMAKETAMKEREIALREREIALKESVAEWAHERELRTAQWAHAREQEAIRLKHKRERDEMATRGEFERLALKLHERTAVQQVKLLRDATDSIT
jgi:hypothetical protein